MRRVHHIDHVIVVPVASSGLFKKYPSDYNRQLPENNVKVDSRICFSKQLIPDELTNRCFRTVLRMADLN